MSKYTNGPWHLLERDYLCVESASGNIALCNLIRDSKADACLIAAAPELLEALRDILETGFDVANTPSRQRARAAIAKAVGEQR